MRALFIFSTVIVGLVMLRDRLYTLREAKNAQYRLRLGRPLRTVGIVAARLKKIGV
jgi:hypothetical protein